MYSLSLLYLCSVDKSNRQPHSEDSNKNSNTQTHHENRTRNHARTSGDASKPDKGMGNFPLTHSPLGNLHPLLTGGQNLPHEDRQSKTNPIRYPHRMNCKTCPYAVNSLNGRYCTQIKKYVEYTKTPPCKTTTP